MELCAGLPISKLEGLTLEQIKAETLIETLGQNVLLRSRQCLYAVYANSESTDERRICSYKYHAIIAIQNILNITHNDKGLLFSSCTENGLRKISEK